jgi:hypothetical protein
MYQVEPGLFLKKTEYAFDKECQSGSMCEFFPVYSTFTNSEF